jgi:hypothetical protein
VSPADAAAVVEAWRALDPRNLFARSFLTLVDAIADDGQDPDPDNLTAAVTSLVRGLPSQWVDLAHLISATGETLEARQVEYDQAFADVVEVMAEAGDDVLDFLAPDGEAGPWVCRYDGPLGGPCTAETGGRPGSLHARCGHAG